MKLRICLCLLLLEVCLCLEFAPLRCPATATSEQCQFDSVAIDEYFFKIYGSAVTIVYSARHFHLTCSENVTLASPALPVFARATASPVVRLSACAPPAAGYARALASLNLTVGPTLTLHQVPDHDRLSSSHFDGLNLTTLHITAKTTLGAETDFLRPLKNLATLHLQDVLLNSSYLQHFPPAIDSLTIARSNIREVSEKAVRNLPTLSRLIVDETSKLNVSLDGVKTLRFLKITAPVVELTLDEALESATFINALAGPSGGKCHVRNLILTNVPWNVTEAWLRLCTELEDVTVERSTRPAGAEGARGAACVRGALRAGLRALTVSRSGLRSLPPDWLAGATGLQRLDLSYNNIETLPPELFVATPALTALDLSANELGATALAAVAEARSLRDLRLSANPLGDLCGAPSAFVPNALSPLSALRALRELRVARAGLRQLCADWRRLPRLALLDLSYNRIAELHFAELQWERPRESSARVLLRGNPLRAVRYSPRDYRTARALPARPALPPMITFVISSLLKCDCESYWFARALRDFPAHLDVSFESLACNRTHLQALNSAPLDTALLAELPPADAGRLPLRAVPPDAMKCVAPAPACPAPCRCAVSGRGSSVSCAGAGLAAVPSLSPDLAPVRALDLSGNNMTRLDPDDIPVEVERLNLSNNSLEQWDVAQWRAGRANRSVWLAGNPLSCSCAVLRVGRDSSDWADVRCATGERAAAALARCTFPSPPPPPAIALPALLAVAGLAVALAGALIAAFLLNPAARIHFKRFLVSRGVCVRWAASALAADLPRAAWPHSPHAQGGEEEAYFEDAAYEYDAFVSYSHADRARAEQLAARLEGAPGRRLCLHQRDWLPGHLITDQILHSITSSGCTVVLVSDAWVRSAWARAEFRSALAVALGSRRPRLLLVLLPELSAPPARLLRLDPALGLYAASNTYLEWSDPLFWSKLDAALPRRKSTPPTSDAAKPKTAPQPATQPAPRASPTEKERY